MTYRTRRHTYLQSAYQILRRAHAWKIIRPLHELASVSYQAVRIHNGRAY